MTSRPTTRARRFLVRTGAMARKETHHIVRDPRNLYLALGLPVVMILIFGFGVSFDIDNAPIAVVDQDGTATSREVVRTLAANGDFEVVASMTSAEDVDRLFRTRDAMAAVVVPAGFERDLARGERASVQVLLDGSDGTTAMSVLGNATMTLRAMAEKVAGVPGGISPPLVSRVRLLFNPDLRSTIFLVPGLVAYVLAIAAVLLTALTVAREWERGNMELLFSTPVGRLEIVAGKLLPYLAIGVVQALLVLVVGTVVFDVPIRGSIALLAAGTLLFLAAALGQGLLISVMTRNQQVATQVGAVSSLLPGLLLSGFLFPIANMPIALQVISAVLPARYYLSLLRGVMLKAAPIGDLWPDLAAMAAFATVTIVIATLRFRRTL